MIVESTTIDRLRGSYASCFGCGLDNLHGLQLDGFERDGDRVTTVVEIPERFCGFEGVVHGGVVATTLDEISAWAAMLTEGVFVFTARLDISYRRKVPALERLDCAPSCENVGAVGWRSTPSYVPMTSHWPLPKGYSSWPVRSTI